MLEAAKSAGACFVTLTYGPLTHPLSSSLNPKHPQLWLKRLRQAVYPNKLRYFLVGEYGDRTHRPHYHAAIFGLDQSLGGGLDGRRGLVALTWKNGHTYTGDLSKDSAGYICGYVTKKMTKKDHPSLNGRYPEFARMSLKPGIGAFAMKDVAGALEGLVNPQMFQTGNFPSVLQHGKKKLPLGRYLRKRLRMELGYGSEVTEDEKKVFFEKMRLMFEDEAFAAKKEKRAIAKYYWLKGQEIANLENKFKIKNQRGTL